MTFFPDLVAIKMCRSRLSTTIILVFLSGVKVLAQTVAGPALDFMPPQGAPFYMNVALVAESVTNLKGGLATGTAYNGLLHTGFAMNSSVIGLEEGGQFRVSALAIASEQPSVHLIGDTQVSSNIEAKPDARLYDAWFRQDFRSLPLRLRIGIIDMNEYFNVTDSAGILLNSSFGIGAVLSANAPFSIYPEPGYGVTAHYGRTPAKLLLGLFDGNPQSRSDPFGAGRLSIAEWQQKTGKDTAFKLGGWDCYCRSAQNGLAKDTTRGLYGSIKTKFNTGGGRAATLFLRSGLSRGADTMVSHSYALGVYYPSILASRPDDIFSAGVTRARFQDGADETSYELTYAWQINENLKLQPDFQYITNPGGYLPDAWVITLRFVIFHDTYLH